MVSLECDFVALDTTERIGASTSQFTKWNKAFTMYDPADSSNTFSIYLSTAAFISNTFTSNYIG